MSGMAVVPVYPTRYRIRREGRWWVVREQGAWRATCGQWATAIYVATGAPSLRPSGW